MATIPDQLQQAFQDAWDAANLCGSLAQQQATLQQQLAAVNSQLAAAQADRDQKEVAVIALTRQLLGPSSLPPNPPSS